MSDQALFLLVEDNEDHVLLIRRAFVKSKVVNPLQVVRNGEDAIAYLEGTGRFSNRAEFPLPSIIPGRRTTARRRGPGRSPRWAGAPGARR